MTQRFILPVLIISHLIFSVLYSLNTPLWAAPDENGHYAYARYIAQHKTLPRMSGTAGYGLNEKFTPPTP